MTTLHRYDLKRALPDHRDLRYSHLLLGAPQIHMPSSADVSHWCSPVEDQGQMGSCSGHALAGAREFRLIKAAKPFTRLSRLFAYWGERVLEHTTGQDAGANLRDGMKALAKWGIPEEALWPYLPENLLKPPTTEAYAEAARHKIRQYVALENLAEIRHCLASGEIVVGGIVVFESMESAQAAAGGMIPMPGPAEAVMGGHAIDFVGYDDAKRLVKFRNSWGTGWGDHGYGYLHYDYFTNGYAFDFWHILD